MGKFVGDLQKKFFALIAPVFKWLKQRGLVFAKDVAGLNSYHMQLARDKTESPNFLRSGRVDPGYAKMMIGLMQSLLMSGKLLASYGVSGFRDAIVAMRDKVSSVSVSGLVSVLVSVSVRTSPSFSFSFRHQFPFQFKFYSLFQF